MTVRPDKFLADLAAEKSEKKNFFRGPRRGFPTDRRGWINWRLETSQNAAAGLMGPNVSRDPEWYRKIADSGPSGKGGTFPIAAVFCACSDGVRKNGPQRSVKKQRR